MMRFETGVIYDEEGSLFSFVPEFLTPKERNLFDQPPFSWVVDSDSFFPLGFFGMVESYDDHVRLARLTMALAVEVRPNYSKQRYYAPGTTRVYNTERMIASGLSITPESCRTALFPTVVSLQSLFAEYPYLDEYLGLRFKESDFSEDGSPTLQRLRLNWNLRTYATFAYERTQLSQPGNERFFGLAEVLPYLASAFQEGEYPADFVEEHHTINPQSKFFRVVRSGLLG